MGSLTQDGRVGELTTPFGKDILVLRHFIGTEGLGELFEFEVDALSETENLEFDQALGKSCTVKFNGYKGVDRYFDGILTRAQWIEKVEDYYHYRLTLRPWFFLLDYKADCRIFLDKTVKEILQDVFTKAGFNDFEFKTTSDYDSIPYCVQYRETDFAFCSRLMEQYGIYYFFKHTAGKHTLILADSRSSHETNPTLKTIPYLPLTDYALHETQLLGTWIIERRVRSGKIQFNDYDYFKPNKRLLAPNESAENYANSKLEIYDYPGKYDDESKGKKFSKYRLEAEQSYDHRRYVEGDAAALFAGTLFTAERHPVSGENREFLVVRASHRFGLQSYRTINTGGGSEPQAYFGSYEFLPSDKPFRNLPHTPRPKIGGIQTAKVVGKKGEESEEISTDENAHIWVQFYWDREPKKSCPVRVAHAWSGKKWGTQFIPRVGMEVVVEFLEGDPDRPLVTGCVYNGDHKVPYALPDHKTQSGTKSESSKGDNGYNEFMFEDKKGSEFIRMHAQGDHLVTINGNQTGSVGALENPDSTATGGNQTWVVGGDRSWKIQKGDDSVELQLGSQSIKIDIGQQSVQAMQGITLNVCFGLSTISIMPASININSPTINLTAMGAINLTAPVVNAGAVLTTPALTAGAAIIGGIPI